METYGRVEAYLALDGRSGDFHFEAALPPANIPGYPLDKAPEPVLDLCRIESRFLTYPTRKPVAVQTDLFWMMMRF
jgi:hypothetical protein